MKIKRKANQVTLPASNGANPADPAGFKQVVEAEWTEIRARRRVWGAADAKPDTPNCGTLPDDAPDPPPSNLVGLALSGGGIRSATFNLGLLQGMARAGVLNLVDYLSTVSGGGFTGGWWSAWLSREDEKDDPLGPGHPLIFPPAEKVEPQRWAAYLDDGRSGTVPDASLSAAANDPVHHLRLFANYLTPRRGFLSADTWRAGTIVTRNLLVTWLVLLPLLLGVVLVGQVFYTLDKQPQDHFLKDFTPASIAVPRVAARTSPPADALADAAAIQRQGARATLKAVADARHARLQEIRYRVQVMAHPLAILLCWTVMLTLLWMLYGPGTGRIEFALTILGTVVALGVGLALFNAVRGPSSSGWSVLRGRDMYLFVSGAIVLLFAFRLLPLKLLIEWGKEGEVRRSQEALLRNRVDRAHSLVLVTLFVTAGVLLVAGFSHDLLWYLFDPDAGGPIPDWIKQAGGIVAVLTTFGTMLYTGIKGAPTSADGEAKSTPGLASRIIFAFAPGLAVLLLAVAAATAGRTLIRRLGDASDVSLVDKALILSVGLFIVFGLYEMVERDDRLVRWRQWLVAVLALGAAGAALRFAPPVDSLTLQNAAAAVAVASGLVALGWIASRAPAAPDSVTDERTEDRRASSGAAESALVALVLFVAEKLRDPSIGGVRRGAFELVGPSTPWVDRVLLAGIAFCGTYALAELLLARCRRRRGLALATAALAALGMRLLLPFVPMDRSALAYSAAAATLAVFAFSWVVGLGWMADPNLVSLHAFYKARLVRAYLGASNRNRRSEEITEACLGDDLPIHTLRNCERGAPYHLLNATLNLAGGRDLSTQQRSADSFVFSKGHCGSSRTGYRPTETYMKGKLTLGTAMAISGAAASPNMGSKTPSAALAMLLSFLNVRLAFWTPTPNQSRWREAQPRLWPFYLIRESLSQTNDLSAYCCVSDGAHFDNTGLYSLVARGCRYILLSDCGADPEPCFEDLGNAIRRCRIDFGAEISIQIDKFTHKEKSPPAAHFVIGSITYSEPHAKALGWRDWKDVEGRKGVVVWIRPSLTAAADSADVRQYGLENDSFPQQTRADQWFDEAQFESYRRLGEQSATQLFAKAVAPSKPEPAAVEQFFTSLATPAVAQKRHFNIDFVEIDGKRGLPGGRGLDDGLGATLDGGKIESRRGAERSTALSASPRLDCDPETLGDKPISRFRHP
ncbi:Patatin-like phospholipase [bacterium JGI 053]|nr:Patatin-like phospholipase [bacterium JGI 053]